MACGNAGMARERAPAAWTTVAASTGPSWALIVSSGSGNRRLASNRPTIAASVGALSRSSMSRRSELTTLAPDPARTRASAAFHPLAVAAVDRLCEDAAAITFAVPDGLREAYAFKAGQSLTLSASLYEAVVPQTQSRVMPTPVATICRATR